MSKKLRRKIFFSWAGGLICGILAKGIVKKSVEFSAIFGFLIGGILTIYFVADYYGFFKLIKKEVRGWFE